MYHCNFVYICIELWKMKFYVHRCHEIMAGIVELVCICLKDCLIMFIPLNGCLGTVFSGGKV